MRICKHILLISFLLLIIGCASTNVTPLTNDMTISLLEKDEITLWNAAKDMEREINEEAKSFDGKENAELYLNKVLCEVAQDFNNPELRMRISVLLDENPNSFVLPNGAAYVNTGLLALLENEAQLASVLAHEFYHFKNRHSLRESRKAENESVTGFIAGIAAASAVGALTGRVNMNLPHAVSNLWKISSMSGYSKELEAEADEFGFIAVVKAGYLPDELPKAFKLLKEFSEKNNEKRTRIFSTHPKLEERIASYTQYLQDPHIRQYAIGDTIASERYNNNVFTVILENAQLNINLRNSDIARDNIDRCLKIKPSCAKGYFLLGELTRRASEPSNTILEEALTYYQKSIELDKNFVHAYREIGLLYRYMNSPDKSRTYLSKYIELAPDEADVPLIRSYLNGKN